MTDHIKLGIVTGIGQTGSEENPMWGNGACTALFLAAQGAKIFGVDIDLDAAIRTQKRVAAEGITSEIVVAQADVTRNAEVKKAVEECINRFGRIDILIKYVSNVS